MAKRPRATRILSEEERQDLLRRREKKKRFQKIDAPERRGPQFVPFLLSILAIAVILYRLFGPELDLGLDFLETEEVEGLSIEDEAPAEVDARFEPAAFRDSIVTLEARLFAPDLGSESLTGLGEALTAELDQLAVLFRAEANESFDAAAESLEASSAAVAQGVDANRLETVRSDWLRIRGELFVPADWFHAGAVDGGEKQRETIELATYRQAAEDTRGLVDDAVAEVESFLGDRPATAEAQASRDAAWRDFVVDWRDQHDGIAGRLLPRLDASATNDQILAVQRYELSRRGVASLVSADRLPDDSLLRTLEEAQTDWQRLVGRFDTLIEGDTPIDEEAVLLGEALAGLDAPVLTEEPEDEGLAVDALEQRLDADLNALDAELDELDAELDAEAEGDGSG